MKNLFIVKRVIEDKTLSDEAFVTWCGLRSIMQKDVKEYFISSALICCAIFNRIPTRSERERTEKGCTELIDKGYIKILIKFSKNEFKANMEALYYENGVEYFSDITVEEMHKIMSLDAGKTDRFKLLRYYACMLSTFNRSKTVLDKYKGKIGGMPMEMFEQMLNITKKSIIDYNAILEKNQILYIVKHADFYVTGNSIREIPNAYSRWKDRNLADAFCGDINGNRKIKNNKIQTNYKRSLAAKFNYFKNGKKYDIKTIMEMYLYAIEKNEDTEFYYKEAILGGYSPPEQELIDMEIFEPYLAEIEELMDNQ